MPTPETDWRSKSLILCEDSTVTAGSTIIQADGSTEEDNTQTDWTE